MKAPSNPLRFAWEPSVLRQAQARHGVSGKVAKLCQQLIGKALEVEAESVYLRRYILSPSGLFLKVYGHIHETNFFAKIYLANQYPAEPRLDMPWKVEVARAASTRSIEEQIETEWSMTNVLRNLAGNNEVARPMGKSLPSRTIVWEEAPGYRVDNLVKKTRWEDPKGRSLAPALYKAGAWLAKVHQAGVQGYRSLDMREVGLKVRELVESRGLRGSKYETTALNIVAECTRAIGQDHLEIPFVLTHGDLCTANLIWEDANQRLTVVDFEHCDYRLSAQDTISILFALRVHLLNPWVPEAAVSNLEESFWWGYGAISRPLFMFVNAVATAMVIYSYLPRVATRGKRRGWWAGVEASVYQALFESSMVTERLGIPRELWKAPSSPVVGMNAGKT